MEFFLFFGRALQGIHQVTIPSQYVAGRHLEPADSVPRYMQNNHPQQTGSLILNHGTHNSLNNYNPQMPLSHSDR